jgi:Fur family peroxide stress response transcriptional regulator
MDRFTSVCRRLGAKITHQRQEIFREVAKAGDHPDVETVYRRVQARIPTISLDTVYRTLWWLEENELIATLGSPRERTRFDANLHHHHHFICTRCGMMQDFESDALDRLNLSATVASIGQLQSLQVEVKGLCRQCSADDTQANHPVSHREG